MENVIRLLTRKPFDNVNFLKHMSHSYDRSFRWIRIWFRNDSMRRVWKSHSLHENCLSLLWQILCFFTPLADLNLKIREGKFFSSSPSDSSDLRRFSEVLKGAAYVLPHISQANDSWELWEAMCELSAPELLHTFPHSSHITNMGWFASPMKRKRFQLFREIALIYEWVRYHLPSKWNRFMCALHTVNLDSGFLHR